MIERAQLEAGLDAAEQGEAGLVLLGGETGIGKTRLSTELAAVAAARGASVVRGRCLEAKAASTPFAPFVEILRVLLLREHPDGAVESVRRGREALARLVPEIESQPALERRPSTADERLPLFYAVLELFGRTAHDRPLLVGDEDRQRSGGVQRDELRAPIPRPLFGEFGLDAALVEREPDRPGKRAQGIMQQSRHRPVRRLGVAK